MRTLFFLLLFSFCGQATVWSQENLVKNPGFEESSNANGQPGGGWWLYLGKGEPELKADRAVAHGGKASARLHAAEEAKCTLVSAPFPVAPGDELRFEAWVRAENLPSQQKPGYVGIAFRAAEGRVFERRYLQPESAGPAWSLVSGMAKAPPTSVSAEIHLGYTNAPGSLWFDDVAASITSPV